MPHRTWIGTGISGVILVTGIASPTAHACKPDLLAIGNDLAARGMTLARKSVEEIRQTTISNLKTAYTQPDTGSRCPDIYTADIILELKSGCKMTIQSILSPDPKARGRIVRSNCPES